MSERPTDVEAWAKEVAAAAERLSDKIPWVTRLIMAQDSVSAARARELVRGDKVEAVKSVYLVGSFARLDYALQLAADGLLSEEWLFHELPSLWRASDPDDTDPRFLELWKTARSRAGRTVRDERTPGLPRARRFPVYRGQRGDDPLGISWTTQRSVAEKFSHGASLRVPVPDGVVLVGSARSSDALAYLTGRGEYEVIIDPKDLR